VVSITAAHIAPSAWRAVLSATVGSDGGAAACEGFGRCRSKGHARAHLFSLVRQPFGPCLAERAQHDSKAHRILLKDTRIVITVKV
jgi:hypothetical protein